ncbi:hypothetical protein N431DRAFT_397928 [Stipitochalara longipes BDJ]|nr:hypothetical protein N431DRAFT_397928 [Stipitochalara longipes BDJ]
MFSHKTSLIFAVLLETILADWRYKSRPDLSPPTLNITIGPSDYVAPGYIFIAPYSWLSWDEPLAHGPLQPAPYIFTSSGELVWSGFGYFSGWGGNFQVAKYKGEYVLFAFEGSRNTKHGHSHGHAKILNKNYETIKEVRSGNHALLDLHEFEIKDEKTALVESYRPVPYELSKFGAEKTSQWLVDATFQELDIETGRLLFEWSSLDHVRPDESVLPISSLVFGTGHNSSDAIDYFHINSVDRSPSNDYLISGRHTSTIYKINGTTGSIIWRLGGRLSNFTLQEGVDFGLQHHARFLSSDRDTEVISLFDNSGARVPREHPRGYENKSSGKVISLNTKTWTASLVQKFAAPDEIFAFSQGGTQVLPNGNVFVNWGSAGAITEFDEEGEVLFHAYLESGDLWKNGDVQNYRGFRFNWKGVPNEEPAVAALVKEGKTKVYVSWNGDTETRVWKFFGVNEEGDKALLGEEKSQDFETSFAVGDGGPWSNYFVEAVGWKGEVLRKSRAVKAEKYVSRYVPAKDNLLSGNGVQLILQNDL